MSFRIFRLDVEQHRKSFVSFFDRSEITGTVEDVRRRNKRNFFCFFLSTHRVVKPIRCWGRGVENGVRVRHLPKIEFLLYYILFYSFSVRYDSRAALVVLHVTTAVVNKKKPLITPRESITVAVRVVVVVVRTIIK